MGINRNAFALCGLNVKIPRSYRDACLTPLLSDTVPHVRIPNFVHYDPTVEIYYTQPIRL